MKRIRRRAYVFDIRRRESKEELAFISGIIPFLPPRSYYLTEHRSQEHNSVKFR